jgi:hypothetical protein
MSVKRIRIARHLLVAIQLTPIVSRRRPAGKAAYTSIAGGGRFPNAPLHFTQRG